MRTTGRRLNIVIVLRLQVGWDREVATGVAHYARQRPGWRLFVRAASMREVRFPPRWRCDGAIVHPDDPAAEAITGVPVIAVGGTHPERLHVRPDDATIARLAAEHLHEIGLPRVTCYTGDKRWSLNREASFRQTAEALGMQYIPCPLRYSYRFDDWSDAATVLGAWLEKLPQPLGVLGVNDGAAREVDQACDLAQLKVPEQVAIIGADNDLMRCELSGTPLTSIDPSAERVGYLAAEALDGWLRTGRPPAESILVSPHGVVKRRSTDVLAIEDEEVATALRFVRDHALERVGVGEVAAAATVSRRVLEKRFRQHVGRSVHQEITRLRLQRACELLRTSESRLDHVARASGFDNLSHFHTIFRRHIGHTPASFRRGARTLS